MQHVSVACLQTLCEQCGECNTHLAQQEELVSTFLGVFITGALHLLQVNPIQLELLLTKTQVSLLVFDFLHTERHRRVMMSKNNMEDNYRNT